MAQLTLSEWLARVQDNPRFMENVTAVKHLPAKEAEFSPYPGLSLIHISEPTRPY